MVENIIILSVVGALFVFVAGSIIRGIKTEIEYRRWWREVKESALLSVNDTKLSDLSVAWLITYHGLLGSTRFGSYELGSA